MRERRDLVPFAKYAKAAESLRKPSSAARAAAGQQADPQLAGQMGALAPAAALEAAVNAAR